MTKFNRFHGFLLFFSLFMFYVPVIMADMQQQGYDINVDVNRTFTPINNDNPLEQSYGEKVANKALNAFANIATSPLELPKNIINTTNQSNFFYGVFGGFLKGLVNLMGRMGCGIADFITIPLPTKPIVYPMYIWDDFDADTSYGGVFRLDKTKHTDQPVTQAPVPQPAPTVVAKPPRALVVDRSSQYNQEVNKNLDMLYNKEMQK
jgi:putative exosortase-associated protein (TIGR04073 family)